MQVDATVIWAEIPWSLVFGKGYRNGIVGTWGGLSAWLQTFLALQGEVKLEVGNSEPSKA